MLGTYHLTVLYDILKDLHFLYQSDRIYIYLLENLVKALDAEAASLFIVDDKKQNLVLRGCVGPKKNMFELIAEEVPFPIGQGICGWVVQYNQSLIIEDVQKDIRFSSKIDTLTGYKTRSVLCAPLSSKDEVMGVIEILNKKSSAFNKNDMDLVSLIGKQTAIALQNARFFTELAKAKDFSECMVSNMTSGFISIDEREIITHLNFSAEKILQFSEPDAVVGKNVNEILKYYPDFHRELTQVLKTKEKKIRQEFICQKPDKTTAKIGFSVFPIIGKSQTVIGSAIIFQDLTNLK